MKQSFQTTVCVLFLVKGIQEALSAERSDCARDLIFVPYPQQKLNLPQDIDGVKMKSSLVDGDMDCTLKCLGVYWCRSVNFGTAPLRPDGRYQCELLSSDQFTNRQNMAKNVGVNHYSVLNPCEHTPCKNGGECIFQDNRKDFRCKCKSGFTGDQCEKDIDDCVNSPCQNQGTCKDLVNGYSCICTEDFKGENCSVNRVSWLKVTSEPVRIGVKDDNYASFTIPTNCTIFRFKLVYDSGPGVTYNISIKPQHWGAGGWLEIHITDDKRRRITPPRELITYSTNSRLGYKIPGVTINGPELPFPEMSPPLSVTAGHEYRAWFGQDLTNAVEHNNAGYVCVNVAILARV